MTYIMLPEMLHVMIRMGHMFYLFLNRIFSFYFH
jgi:hypothetical protein